MKPLAIIAALALTGCVQGTVEVPENITLAEAVFEVGMNMATATATGLFTVALAIFFGR